MNLSIISPAERELLKKIESNNDTDVSLWRISNILIPITTIIISIVCYSLFKPNCSVALITYLNLLLNGAIPMIALNRIGGLGIYLFKYDKSSEKKYGIEDTSYLRTKLFFAFLIVLFGTVILYVYQVLRNPFALDCGIVWVLLFSIISVYLSIDISKSVYLLQEKLIDNTFADLIKEGTNQNKKHLSDKYGE